MGHFGQETVKPHLGFSNARSLLQGIAARAGYLSNSDREKMTKIRLAFREQVTVCSKVHGCEKEPQSKPAPGLHKIYQSGQSMVPAVATILRFREPAPTPQRNEGYSSSSAASPPQRGPELSATQATFLAGAAVTHAHHASGVALGAATLAHQAAERERERERATNGSTSPGGRHASQCASCHGRGATPWRSAVDCASRAGYRG